MTWIGPLTMSDTNFPGRLPNYRGYIDLTNPAAVKEFEKRLSENQYAAGVRGHKMDRADENFPVTARWYLPITESESRNTYIYLYAKVIDEFLSKAYGKDQFNFARAAYHRCQPYLSAVWGGDSRSNWQGMAGSAANAMRCGFLGFPDWGNDTGGYLGEGRIEEELYMRWLQWSAWNGMFEVKIDGAGGSGEDRPPWKYSNQLQQTFREACAGRMDLLPYIYSCVNTSYLNGVVMKPLAYEYLDDGNTYAIWDEYIFGNAFLVAPVFTKNNSRTIYLPKGRWYDYHDYNINYNGPATFTQNVPATAIPVFIKGNSIFITGQIYRGNSRIWENRVSEDKKIIIHLFPGQINEQVTFRYVDYLDNDKEKSMVLERRADTAVFTSEPLRTASTIEIKCDMKPSKILFNNKPVDFNYNKTKNTASIQIEKNRPICLIILTPQ